MTFWGDNMHKYTKIETPFNRDNDGSKLLIEGSYRNETVEFLSACQWYGTEKVDGTNIGIVWDGHSVSFQGRTEKAQIPPHLITALENLFLGNINEEIFEQLFGEKEVVLFGEGYGAGIQKGGIYRPDCSFILFDIYMPGENIWLRREAVEEIGKTLNIDVVPILYTGTLDGAVEFVKTKPFSKVAIPEDTVIEGIVCKPMVDLADRRGNRVIVKVKVCDFE